MSYSNYSIRDRNRRETSDEASERKAGQATPVSIANASSVIYLGNIPNDWSPEIVSSVVAGSGKIVDIRPRIDSSGRGKNFCFVEYLNPQEASRALQLLSEIKLGPKRKLRVELSKEGLRGSHPRDRPLLNLSKDFLPYYVQIPAAMREGSNEPPQGYSNQSTPFDVNSTPIPNTPPVKQEPMPEVLAKASQYLPRFNPNALRADDKISQNLQAIPPAQLIEMISTLKQLASTNIGSVQHAFSLSPNLSVAVVQSMILMGLIDVNTLTTAIQQQMSATPQNSNMNIQPAATATPAQQTPPPDPRWANLPYHTVQKLSQKSPEEANMITQVLLLPPSSLDQLPPPQRQMAESLRAQYL